MKITSPYIIELKDNEIFVFGANEKFIHGAGAAKQALKWGAKYGKSGICDRTYGIPTKNKQIQTLSLSKIEKHIEEFIQVVKDNPDLEFLVTEVACGLAGYKPKDIAPFFFLEELPVNISLPESFWKFKK